MACVLYVVMLVPVYNSLVCCFRTLRLEYYTQTLLCSLLCKLAAKNACLDWKKSKLRPYYAVGK